MRIEASGVISDAAARPDAERIAFFTSLCVLANGDILAGGQVGPGKHAPTSTDRLFRSRDGGNTWNDVPFRFETLINGVPGSLSGPELVEAEPGRLLLFTTWFDRSDPARPLFDPTTEGLLRSRQLLAVSTDDGETWGPWQTLDTGGLTGCATTGPAHRWPDGTIAYAFESFKEFDDPAPSKHGAWLLVSRDGGRTFGKPVLVARDPRDRVYYWDQRLCVGTAPDDSIALFWTHDRDRKQDLDVHILRGSIRDTAMSQPRPTGIAGQIAAPLLLPAGRLLAFVVDRGRPGTMKLWSSPDGGTTWPTADALPVHIHDERAALSQGRTDIDFAQYWEDMGKWSFGHPAIRQLADGRVLLAYYAGNPERMSLHWARVDVAGENPASAMPASPTGR